MKVFIAEDDPDVLMVSSLLLEQAGWDVVSAPDGAQALETLNSTEVDIAVLDQAMPGMNGLDVFKHRRALGDRTPFMLWTAYTAPVSMDEAAELEVTVVTKTGADALPRLINTKLASRPG